VRWWPRGAAFAALAALVALGAWALARGGGDGQDQPGRTGVPEAGSAFGGGRREPAPRRRARRGPPAAARLPVALERAVAQLFMVGFKGTLPRSRFFFRLGARDWGGVILTADNYVEPGQLKALAGEVGVVARNAGHAPPIVAAAQLGGPDSAFANLPPSPQSRVGTPAQAHAEAVLAGRQLKALDIRMTFAPAADVAAVGGPWEGRAFSDSPALVARLARAAVDGYTAAGVASAPGHFPGEGAASADPGESVATVGLSLEELRARDLRPFAALVRRAPAITMSAALYAAFDGVTPATLLPEAVALLRGMGFRGVVVSADLASVALATGGTPARAAVEALEAGCDLLLLPGNATDQERAYRAVLDAVRSGRIQVRRVARALARVASLRRRAGVG
jgi:beta-N-acetylhexosaminidase